MRASLLPTLIVLTALAACTPRTSVVREDVPAARLALDVYEARDSQDDAPGPAGSLLRALGLPPLH